MTNSKLASNILLLFVVLFSIWVLLSGNFSRFLLLCGVASSLIAVYVAFRMEMLERHTFQKPLYISYKVISYLAWLLKEIAVSSFATAQTIWQLNPKISPILGCVPATQDSDAATALYANSITLTPGTVSVMVEKKKILVHALQKEGYEDLARGGMDSRVTYATGGHR
jgi:multicomponent Na+:H+ antiporter subunit E